MDRKKSIQQAIEKYISKNTPKVGPKRKNDKPEKEVERLVLEWMRGIGWSIEVIESKSTYSKAAGRWIGQSVKQGFSDIVGTTSSGVAVYVELKAPGKRHTLRANQRTFLLEKIDSRAFVCVTDSVKFISDVYATWAGLDIESRVRFLREMMPVERKRKNDDSFF